MLSNERIKKLWEQSSTYPKLDICVDKFARAIIAEVTQASEPVGRETLQNALIYGQPKLYATPQQPAPCTKCKELEADSKHVRQANKNYRAESALVQAQLTAHKVVIKECEAALKDILGMGLEYADLSDQSAALASIKALSEGEDK